MKNIRTVCWLLFIVTALVLRARAWYVNNNGGTYNIVKLELADAKQGPPILEQWNGIQIDTSTQLRYARTDLWIDFLFILGYTGILIIVSYFLMQRQRQLWLNELLRLCMPLAILAALLDIIENSILLFDVFHYRLGKSFFSAMYVAYPKFALIIFILLSWVLAVCNRWFKKGTVRQSSQVHSAKKLENDITH